MKKASGLFYVLMITSGIANAQQAGGLDTTFNTTGKLIANIAGDDGATSVIVQPDGKTIVGGYSGVSNNYSFALSRYNIDGTPDTSFGVAGKVVTDFAPGYDFASSLLLQPDGKIIAGGQKWNGTSGENALIRYNADGNIDSTFGLYGKVWHPVGTADAGISAMALQPDGKILAAGICTSFGTGHDFALTRYNTDGTLDNSFGVSGSVIADFANTFDFPFALALQSDGKILIGGATGNDPFYDFGLMRIDSSGNLDFPFGAAGKVTTDFGKPDEWAYALALQDDGKIILGGTSGSPYKVAMVRYTTTGIPDTTFNITGKVITAISAHDEVNAIGLDATGNIIVAGLATVSNNQDFLIARFLTNGNIDNTFGTNGSVKTDFNVGADKAKSMVISPDNKITAAGVAAGDFAIARYIGTFNTGVIDFAPMNNSVLIYPNPVQTNATLTYALKEEGNISISLFDNHSRLLKTFAQNIFETAGEHTQAIALPAHLQHGEYYIVIAAKNEKVSIRFIK